ncbi:hypothetical protein [Hymenobacter daeguensis]
MKLLLLPLAFLLHCFAPRPPRIDLSGYVVCQSAMMEASFDRLTTYARTQHDCRNGEVVLAFEKRLSKPTEKAEFEIADTVHVRMSAARQILHITTCKGSAGKPRLYFVLATDTPDNPRYLRRIRRAWGLNAQHQLVPVPIKTIECLNPDYGADYAPAVVWIVAAGGYI